MRVYFVAIAAALLTSAGCEKKYPEPIDVTKARPDSIDILPSPVFVATGHTFALESRLWDGIQLLPHRYMVLDPATNRYVSKESPWSVSWDVSWAGPEDQGPVFDIKELGTNHRVAEVTVSPRSAPARDGQPRGYAEVTAEWNGHKAFARLTEVPTNGDNEFKVTVPHAYGSVPTALLFDAAPASGSADNGFGSVSDSIVALVGRGSLGKLEGMEKVRIATFSGEYRSSLTNEDLGSGSRAKQDGSMPGSGLIGPDTITVFIWIAGLNRAKEPLPDSERTRREMLVVGEVILANEILSENRAGFRLKPAEEVKWLESVAVYSDVFNLLRPCTISEQLHEHIDPSSLELGVFHIVYLDDWEAAGEACEASNFAVASLSAGFATTLIHEFGHFAGLDDDWVGLGSVTIDTIRTANNIMANGEGDLDGTNRDHITLGQVFRMNWDSESIIYDARLDPFDANADSVRSRANAVACPLAGSEPACPPPELDIGYPFRKAKP